MPPRQTKRQRLDSARPHVEQLVAEEQEARPARAQALLTVLALAEDAVRATETTAARSKSLTTTPMAINVPWDLYLRAQAAPNLTATIVEGWDKFLAGEFVPEQPQRAAPGRAVTKTPINFRAPADKVREVGEKADAMVAERGWSVKRGEKLLARHVAEQWLALKFPAPEDDSVNDVASAAE